MRKQFIKKATAGLSQATVVNVVLAVGRSPKRQTLERVHPNKAKLTFNFFFQGWQHLL